MTFPLAISCLRKRLRLRNDGETRRSERCGSQLSSRVSISSFSRSFCSAVKPAIHFCLSNLAATAFTVLGAPKNEVMLAFFFAFLASVAISAALRLTPDMMGSKFVNSMDREGGCKVEGSDRAGTIGFKVVPL